MIRRNLRIGAVCLAERKSPRKPVAAQALRGCEIGDYWRRDDYTHHHPQPDDWHLHVRDGEMLKAVLPYTAKDFGRAILMPNLTLPVRTTRDAMAYRANGSRRRCRRGRAFSR